MARVKKTVSEKEQDLRDIIKEAQEKLDKLLNKQRSELGQLACKYKLNDCDLSLVEEGFKELSLKMHHQKK